MIGVGDRHKLGVVEGGDELLHIGERREGIVFSRDDEQRARK